MDLNFTSDLVGFWNLYVVVIVLGSILFCAVFLWMQGSSTFKPGEVTGHVWDETLEEYSNPLPNWWRWMFYLTIIFAFAYLAMYPGLGNMTGGFGWTMRDHYDDEMKAAEAQYGPKFNQFLKQDVMTVAKNQEAKEMGQRLFQTYCAQCHGGDAGGAPSFPSLKDGDWLWGGAPDKIKETIVAGRMGVMTPKGTMPDMNAEQIKDMVHYVRSLSAEAAKAKNTPALAFDAARAQRGAELYPQACAACHQPDGKGLQAAGYPNLTDTVWLHGSSEARQIDIVTKGMTNQMPAFGEFLGEAKVHLLTAYVWGLGGGVQPEEAAPSVAEVAPAATEQK